MHKNIKEIRIETKEYKGKKYVDVRRFFSKNGKMIFTKKGITLNQQELPTILNALEQVENEFSAGEIQPKETDAKQTGDA